MRKVIAVLLFSAMVTLAAVAQPNGEKARQRFEKMSEELSLTDAQKVKMKEIHESYGLQIQALKSAEGENAAEIRKLRKEKQEKLKEVLTKEQLEKLETIKKENKKKKTELRKEIRQYQKEVMLPVLKAQRMEFDKLLTNEEKKVIEDLRIRQREMHKQSREIRKTGKEADNKDQNKKGRHEMMKKRNEQFRKDCKNQLTPIIESHAADLKKVESNLEPQRNEWEAQLKLIRTKHLGESPETENHPKTEKHKQRKEEQMNIRFLLLDPNSDLPEKED